MGTFSERPRPRSNGNSFGPGDRPVVTITGTVLGQAQDDRYSGCVPASMG